jgi:hypothetical protein
MRLPCLLLAVPMATTAACSGGDSPSADASAADARNEEVIDARPGGVIDARPGDVIDARNDGMIDARTGDSNVFRITCDGTICYNVNGQNVDDPTITLVRGRTYTFNIMLGDEHPLELREGSPTGGQYSDGITGIHPTIWGTLTFKPTVDAPDRVYYQCVNHTTEGGEIRITDP